MSRLSEVTSALMPHLMLAPIALPMFTAALLLLLREEQQRLKFGVSLVSTLVGLLVSIALLQWVHRQGAEVGMGVYLPGNWPAPFGIVLVLDRLTALMLLLTSLVALCSVLFAGARWQRAGVLYQALFQFQLKAWPERSSPATCSTCSCSSRSCWPPPTACCCMARGARACSRGCTTSPSTWRRRRCF